jgi:hypothetical protein
MLEEQNQIKHANSDVLSIEYIHNLALSFNMIALNFPWQ